MTRIRFVVVVAIAGIALLLARWLWHGRSAPPAAVAEGVKTVTLTADGLRMAALGIDGVTMQPLVRVVTLTGSVVPEPDHLARVHPRSKGRVVSLLAQVGDAVREGQVLAVICSEELHAAQVGLRLAERKRELAAATLQQKRALASLGEYTEPPAETARAREAESVAEAVSARGDARTAQAGVADATARLEAAQAGVQQAEARRDVARAREARAQRMLEVGVVSKQDLEMARAERASADADVAAARAGLRQAETSAARAREKAAADRARARAAGAREQVASQARVREDAVRRRDLRGAREVSEADIALRQADIELEAARDEVALLGASPSESHEIKVRSPISGRVVERGVAPGSMVETSQALYTVLSLVKVWAQLDVFQGDLPGISVDQPVTVTSDAVPGATFSGTVSYVSDAADEATHAFRVRAVIDNRAQRLRAGMFVSAKLRVSQGRDAIGLPPAAVQQVDGRAVVFVATNDPQTFVVRPVEVGLSTDDRVEITRGLSVGERVVIREATALKAQAVRGELTGE